MGQLRIAATSVPAPTFEGNSRHSRKQYIQFLIVTRASLEEDRYDGLTAMDLQYTRSPICD